MATCNQHNQNITSINYSVINQQLYLRDLTAGDKSLWNAAGRELIMTG